MFIISLKQAQQSALGTCPSTHSSQIAFEPRHHFSPLFLPGKKKKKHTHRNVRNKASDQAAKVGTLKLEKIGSQRELRSL